MPNQVVTYHPTDTRFLNNMLDAVRIPPNVDLHMIDGNTISGLLVEFDAQLNRIHLDTYQGRIVVHVVRHGCLLVSSIDLYI